MRISIAMAAAIVIGLAGCASTENKNVETVHPKQPVPDKVPSVAAAASQAGSNEAAGGTVPNSLLSRRSVYFDFDNYEVKSEYAEMLERHGKFLTEKHAARIMVQGHADERGSHEYNLALGQKRAEAVRRTLLLHGAREGQLEAVSFGEEKPSVEGAQEAAWSQNRRADLAYPAGQ